MKSGVNVNVTMTAYITASLLELETPVTDHVITKALSCLKSVIKVVKNTYTTALLAYTFSRLETQTLDSSFSRNWRMLPFQTGLISTGLSLHLLMTLILWPWRSAHMCC
ncbi:hypothetical protein cypCar_00050020 [Cyprinus carpio]|nr:hypothetical protein cypCar_00050020 [Cyprinus carpio]